MADIGDFGVNQEALPLILANPKTKEDLLNDDKQPMTIYLYGLDSEIGETASKEIKSGNRKDKVLSEAEIKKNSINLLARCSAKFENVQIKGESLECSHKTALELYTEYKWIFEQAAGFIGVRSNHLGNSPEG